MLEEAISAIRSGRPVIIIDNEDRENECDVVFAAERVTPEAVIFMLNHAKGLICVSMDSNVAERLEIKPMVENNEDPLQTNFGVSLDHIQTSTGISAFDRALTIRAIADPVSRPEDFRRPGHIFPLIARDIKERQGHTEASVELMKRAEMQPVAAICEILNKDGTMARERDVKKFGIPILHINVFI
ncbi:MAG: 3,4-dihydroxy-2-butanone-4-phosphate synthase [Candidatus Diapherotrites archaeon]|nr:3,4-dihydroxy-2-butanone-4-phosphate synthase [Candidatus Diapherotrites archaeon]